MEITFEDENGDTGYIQLLNNTFFLRELKLKERYLVVGKPQFQKNKSTSGILRLFQAPSLKKTACL